MRDALWDEVRQYAGQGRALLVHTTNSEQGFTFRAHDHTWQPVDHEGLTLLHRPTNRLPSGSAAEQPKGWSAVSKRRRFRK